MGPFPVCWLNSSDRQTCFSLLCSWCECVCVRVCDRHSSVFSVQNSPRWLNMFPDSHVSPVACFSDSAKHGTRGNMTVLSAPKQNFDPLMWSVSAARIRLPVSPCKNSWWQSRCWRNEGTSTSTLVFRLKLSFLWCKQWEDLTNIGNTVTQATDDGCFGHFIVSFDCRRLNWWIKT